MADFPLIAGFALIIHGVASLGLALAMQYWTRRSEQRLAVVGFLLTSALLSLSFGVSYIGIPEFVASGWNWPPRIWRGTLAVSKVAFGLLAFLWIRVAAVTTRSPLLAWAAGSAGYRRTLILGIAVGTANAVWNFFARDLRQPQAYLDDALIVIAGIYVIVATVMARLRAAPRSMLRRRATAYLFAFMAHDVALAAVAVVSGALLAIDLDLFIRVAPYIYIPAGTWLTLVFLPLLSYSVLSGQLLDVDRKFRLTVSRASLAGVFVAVFVAGQTFVSEYFTETSGLLGGAIAAGLLVIILNPLMRLTESIGSATVPMPSNLEEFYREQAEIAYSDGHIGPKERQALRSVRERLGLSADAALRIEEAVVS